MSSASEAYVTVAECECYGNDTVYHAKHVHIIAQRRGIAKSWAGGAEVLTFCRLMRLPDGHHDGVAVREVGGGAGQFTASLHPPLFCARPRIARVVVPLP